MTTTPYVKGDTLLTIDHVSLSFGDRPILRDVNATIQDIVRPDCITGQVVCFLGRSGIGKTQLSRVIAGLQQPTQGAVSIVKSFRGHAEFMAPVEKGDVGMVPQNYPLFEFATVRDNLDIAGRQGGLSAADARSKANALLVAFDLVEHLGDYPAALSGGTRQRVAIVRQLMCAGHFLVLDEPFSGLDPRMKAKACQVIRQVAALDEQNTIIIVTHDVAEGVSVADTVWLMGLEHEQPGARILEQYDLAAMNLCWHEDVCEEPEFIKFVNDIKKRIV